MTSRFWYVVAVVAFLAGGAGAGMLVWSGISGLDDGFTRLVAPGSTVLTLREPGSYTIYHEAESAVDGRLYVSSNIDGLRIAVIEEDGGGQVAVTSPGMTSRYSIGGHSGVSVLAFEIARPGRYRLTAAYGDGRAGPAAVLAVGHDFFGRLAITILGAVGSAFAGFAAALAITLVTFFRRRRLERGAATRRV